jgi:hypothetical protein
MLTTFETFSEAVVKKKQYRQSLIDQSTIAAFVHDMLLDDDPKMFNHG